MRRIEDGLLLMLSAAMLFVVLPAAALLYSGVLVLNPLRSALPRPARSRLRQAW